MYNLFSSDYQQIIGTHYKGRRLAIPYKACCKACFTY